MRRVNQMMAWTAAVVLTACTSSEMPDDAPARPDEAMSSAARWVGVRAAGADAVLELPARVVADARGAAEVTALYAGQVRRVAVQPGDPVTEGAPVVEIAAPELAAAVAELGAATRQLELLERRFGELGELRKQGLARQSQVFELEARVAELEARRGLALAQVRSAGLSAADKRSLASTGRVVLRSPVAGVVTDVHVHLGQTVSPDGHPLVQVQGQGSARVEVQLPSPVPEGAALDLVAYDGARHGLDPAPVASVVDPETGTLRAWFALKEGRLPSGLRGTVEVRASDRAWSSVPSRAVVEREQGPSVFVRRGGRTFWVPVEVQAKSGADAVVQGDLQKGDEVLADGRAAPASAPSDSADAS